LNEALDLKGIDPVTGERTAYTIYENAPQFVDKGKTIANINTLMAATTPPAQRFKTQKCGAGGYTKVLSILQHTSAYVSIRVREIEGTRARQRP
jgi:hypothetical protein